MAAHLVGEVRVAEHGLDARRQLGVVARLEEQSGAGVVDQLGETAGPGDHERCAAGERLEGDDPERLVQRRDDDAAGAVDRVAQPVVGEEAGEVDEIADALEVDLRLQLGEVAAAAADDALDARHPCPQQPHRPGEDLEALLVLDPAPREHERRAPSRRLAGRPPRRVDAVGDQVGALGGQLEAADHLADEELRAGEHLGGVVGEPRLDGVDRARLAGRHPAAVLAALGGVEGGDELGGVQRRQRVGGPGDVPVVGVDDVGAPVAELRR